MKKSFNTKYIKTFGHIKKLIWYVAQETTHIEPTDVIYYDQKLALQCNAGRMSDIIADVLKNEFSDKITNSEFYNLLLYVLTNKLCTLQSIKNVLSYKKKQNIKEIQDVSFNNGEVQLKCLI
ncbi:MAG: hypothetical protein PHV37_08010 [Candidatus Gastranaerophilales bacterium]|nr:hypothetical protein [Candidatus Gastranaerophilales bacterium]